LLGKRTKDLISKRLEKAILIRFSIRNRAIGPRELGFMKEIFAGNGFDKGPFTNYVDKIFAFFGLPNPLLL